MSRRVAFNSISNAPLAEFFWLGGCAGEYIATGHVTDKGFFCSMGLGLLAQFAAVKLSGERYVASASDEFSPNSSHPSPGCELNI